MSRPLAIVILFLLITGGLLALDYQNEQGFLSNTFVSSIIQTFVSPTTITPELLKKTSFKENTLESLDRSNNFFSQYLKLPNNLQANRFQISGTTIQISELRHSNPLKIIENLLSQQSDQYQFNRVQNGIFYVNQIPLETKTHNFLTIVINSVLYGFEYKPFDHPKVLELIDALMETQ